MKYTKHHEPLSSAKAVIALLILSIAFVVFYKFYQNQEFFLNDMNALRSYVIAAIVGSGFLIGLLYLTSQTTHNAKAPSKSSKTSKSKKKKK